jgi:predicted DNA-binding transcriptional regulator AlpA
MTEDRDAQHSEEVRLAPESVEALARRLAELLADRSDPGPPSARRLMTAAEVSAWWGVERPWVYAHADQLGARRLGAGQRPRLRFDPDEVAERLGDATPSADRARSPRMRGDPRHSTRLLREPELSSRGTRSRPGGAPTPPATAPKQWPSAR